MTRPHVLSNLPDEAEQRYNEAKERYEGLKQLWQERGCPALSTGSTGQEVEHPLVKMIREHEILLHKLAEPLQKRHRGPEPSAVVRASIGDSPAARLRKVK